MGDDFFIGFDVDHFLDVGGEVVLVVAEFFAGIVVFFIGLFCFSGEGGIAEK